MTTPDRTNPPDLPAGATTRRLLRLWWDERRIVGLALVCALVYTAALAGAAVVVQRVIDDAIVPDDTAACTSCWALLVVLALLRAGIAFCRRYATATIGIRVEARMRALLYDGYLAFPRAFYDRQTTGQVVSRATNDLYPIRYFVGWGAVQRSRAR